MRAGRHRDRRESPNSMRRPYTRAREHRSRHRRWSRRRPGARHRRELDHRCPLGARGGPRARRAPWLALAQGLGVRSRGRGGAAVDLGVERQEPLDEEEKSSSNRSSAWEAIGAARPLLSTGASWEPIACRRTPGPRPQRASIPRPTTRSFPDESSSASLRAPRNPECPVAWISAVSASAAVSSARR
jgi:hypothetical protein